MFYDSSGIRAFLGMLILVLSLLMISYPVEGEERSDGPDKESMSKRSYSLTIEENVISLSATNASLKEIVEEIGHRMKIEVVTHIRNDETISIKFDDLPIEESIRRLSTNHVYLIDSEREKGRIAKIVILPKGQGKVSSGRIKEQTRRDTYSQATSQKKTSGKSSESVPFKFEFDPSKFLKEKK